MKSKKEDSKADNVPRVIINLKKCSQNWKSLPQEVLPQKPLYKRQEKKKNHAKETKESSDNKIPVSAEKVEPTPEKIEEKPKIWFEVDKAFINHTKNPNETLDDKQQTNISSRLTKALAMDCEMVGVGDNGADSIVARVSLVNQFGECVYDKYVLPTEKVVDYRTKVSGIRPFDISKDNGAVQLSVVQKEVTDLINGRILVGHAVHNDLQVLFLSHPKKKIRDTQKCKAFRRKIPSIGSLSSLKNLAKLILGIDIQSGEHNSVVDAQVTMRLYTMFKKEWEADIRDRKSNKKSENETKLPEIVVQSKDEDNIDIKTGNDNHKRYLKNKLKKRNNFIKKFKK